MRPGLACQTDTAYSNSLAEIVFRAIRTGAGQTDRNLATCMKTIHHACRLLVFLHTEEQETPASRRPALGIPPRYWIIRGAACA